MSSLKYFFLFLGISLLTSRQVFAEIRTDCLWQNDKWKPCHVDFNDLSLQWRLKNSRDWSELLGHRIKRIVQTLPAKPLQQMTVGFDLGQIEGVTENLPQNIKADQGDKSYPVYVPIEWQNTGKSILAIEYVTENGGRSIFFMTLSIKDEFVVKSRLESLSGLVIEKNYGR